MFFSVLSTASHCTSSRAGVLVSWPQSEHSWRKRCSVGPSPGKHSKGKDGHAGGYKSVLLIMIYATGTVKTKHFNKYIGNFVWVKLLFWIIPNESIQGSTISTLCTYQHTTRDLENIICHFIGCRSMITNNFMINLFLHVFLNEGWIMKVKLSSLSEIVIYHSTVTLLS